MSTEELEKILRSDADAPEGEESDAELILHIMEVLVNRKKETGNTGKTAAQAWEDFQRHYLPSAVEPSDNVPKKKRPAGRWPRRLIAAATAVVLVVFIPLTASALGWKDIWNAVATWAKETFSFVGSENTEYRDPSPDYTGENASFQEFLAKNEVDVRLVPTWIPDGYVLESVKKELSPVREIYMAHYTNGDDEFFIRVQTYISTDAQNLEMEEDILETYPSADIVYYIFSNEGKIQVTWVTDPYECCISGDISLEEAQLMIDSIGKG